MLAEKGESDESTCIVEGMAIDVDEVVVQIESLDTLRALPISTQAMLRTWMVSVVGEDTWERAVSIQVRQGGEITISRYAVDDDGYVINLHTGEASQEQVQFRASAPYPIHLIGLIV